IVTFALERLRAMGHRRAMLTTQTHRIVAIKCYLDLGFVPDMTRENAYRAWTLISEELDHPALQKVLR
ncbi:MAG: N-acetyltransferase, partial [Planctomycetota bacterium]